MLRFPAQEGERDALTLGQQDRCHVRSREKSNKTHWNSHGFEFSRTLSCNNATTKQPHVAPFVLFAAIAEPLR